MSQHKKIKKSDRIKVYEKYNGHCAYCGCELEYKDMQVDHVQSVWQNEYRRDYLNVKAKSNDEIDNLDNYMPSCRSCNLYKSSSDLEVFRKNLTEVMMKNLQKDFRYKMALKYGLIKEEIEPVQFYFERT